MTRTFTRRWPRAAVVLSLVLMESRYTHGPSRRVDVSAPAQGALS
ncbi:MAG: hypothetical protein OXU42_15985 [Deltaproteobacteria bacterium]|nr:hypothetical protein [Deltaproteobacteria bacterium]